MPSSDLSLLEDAALKLSLFLDEIVFVGGATLGVLISDDGAAPVRGTLDVDVIAEISTYAEYITFAERLRAQKFSEDTRENAPTCRWIKDGLVLDVMALEKEVLGYSNRWYRGALHAACSFTLPDNLTIKVITAPYFLGTKMEAFRGRGKGDFFESHDLEDFIAVIEGRSSVLEEIKAAPNDLRLYLAEAAKELLATSRFLDALPGFLLPDEISQQRVPMVLSRLADITRPA